MRTPYSQRGWIETEEATCKWRLEVGRFSAQVGPPAGERGYGYATFDDCDIIEYKSGFDSAEDARIAAKLSLRKHLSVLTEELRVAMRTLLNPEGEFE